MAWSPQCRAEARGAASELIVLERGKASTQAVDADVNGIVFAGGTLWGCTGGAVRRQTATGWETVEGVFASSVVPTPRGALFFSETTATEWNGKIFTSLPLPGSVAAGVSVGPIVWLVGDETALRRGP